MTLLMTMVAAIVSTYIWYKNAPEDTMKISTLCWLYWGASLMWMVDAIFEYVELKAEFFTPALADVANDAFLGMAVITFGLIIWIVRLLISDPKNVMKKAINKNM